MNLSTRLAYQFNYHCRNRNERIPGGEMLSNVGVKCPRAFLIDIHPTQPDFPFLEVKRKRRKLLIQWASREIFFSINDYAKSKKLAETGKLARRKNKVNFCNKHDLIWIDNEWRRNQSRTGSHYLRIRSVEGFRACGGKQEVHFFSCFSEDLKDKYKRIRNSRKKVNK